MAASCHAKPSMVFRRVVLPGSLPLIMAGLRLAINTAFVITIAVELVAAERGLGALIWLSWEIFKIDELYATIAAVAVLGSLFNIALKRAHRKLVPWQGHGVF